MLTIRIHPKSEESLSSYILRLCSINKIDVKDLLKHINTYYKLFDLRFMHQIDINPTKFIDIQKLVQLTGLEQEDIFGCTLLTILRLFVTNSYLYNIKGKSDSLLMNFYTSKDRIFCTECLKEDIVYRLEWQLNEVKVCSKHQVCLKSFCSMCGQKQPYYHENLINAKCAYCDMSLLVEWDLTSDTREINKSSHYSTLISRSKAEFHSPFIDQKINLRNMIIKLLYICSEDRTTFNITQVKNLSRDCKYKLIHLLKKETPEIESIGLPIKTFINLLEVSNFSFFTFNKLQVSNEFINSLNEYLHRESFIQCLSPWCSNFKRNNGLQKIKTFRSKTHNSIHICTGCCIKYGVNRSNNNWEEYGDIITLGFYKVRPLINGLISISETAKRLDISRYKVNKIIAYLSKYELLSPLIANKYSPSKIEKFDITFLINSATNNEQATIKKCKRYYKISQRDIFYFYFDSNVHKAIYNLN
ncbi:TniQ protein [Bacillus sp. V-88]|jgi:hypothetical protein|nr:TniQ protein [Bacillus sp. V-88]SLK24205.1 TniQ protein [Bacillus sp. V-88]